MSEVARKGDTSFRAIGALYYGSPRQMRAGVGGIGATWPFAELIIEERDVRIRHRFWLFRRIVKSWYFTLDDMEYLGHRSVGIFGENYYVVLRDGRAVRFSMSREEGEELQEIVGRNGVAIRRKEGGFF